MATANPALNEAVYRRAGFADAYGRVMTLEGSVIKTGILVVILLATALYTWAQAFQAGVALDGAIQLPARVLGLLWLGLIGGSITAFLTIFIPRIAPVTAPI